MVKEVPWELLILQTIGTCVKVSGYEKVKEKELITTEREGKEDDDMSKGY